MASSGVATAQAKKAYNAVQSHLEALDKLIVELQTNVELLNKEVWYGGKRANTWYTNMNERFANLVKFDNGITTFQSNLYSVFVKSSASGIEF